MCMCIATSWNWFDMHTIKLNTLCPSNATNTYVDIFFLSLCVCAVEKNLIIIAWISAYMKNRRQTIQNHVQLCKLIGEPICPANWTEFSVCFFFCCCTTFNAFIYFDSFVSYFNSEYNFIGIVLPFATVGPSLSLLNAFEFITVSRTRRTIQNLCCDFHYNIFI